MLPSNKFDCIFEMHVVKSKIQNNVNVFIRRYFDEELFSLTGLLTACFVALPISKYRQEQNDVEETI